MSSPIMDPGLHSLVAIARFHQLPAEPEQLSHEFGIPGQTFTDTEILLAAKALTLKAKQLTLSIPSLVKYRKLFSEVLIASFFLQIFALVIPLFFQVVMDKVLVHRGFTTPAFILF